MSEDNYSYYRNELDSIKVNNQFRYLKSIQHRRGKYIIYNNKKYLNLSSNDYLGISSDEAEVSDFYKDLNADNVIDSYGLGSTSSRLISGDSALYADLESTIAEIYNEQLSTDNHSPANKKQALIFNSGYHANVGIIPALTERGDLIISDSLNHASIIDGSRLSRADRLIFDHRNYEELREILEKKRNNYNKIMIISESVFSMDGDIADLKKLAEIKDKYNALLYIDEAHALGIFGSNGLGICERENIINDIDIIVSSFGKSMASIGAFAVCDPVIKEYLINKMRPFIFTTALPPVILSWNLAVIKRLGKFNERRKKLVRLADDFRAKLIDRDVETCGESQIIPALTGDNEKTLKICEKLQDRGYLLFPIRPPTVPPGSSRIRISLTANIEWEDIEMIPDIISENM